MIFLPNEEISVVCVFEILIFSSLFFINLKYCKIVVQNMTTITETGQNVDYLSFFQEQMSHCTIIYRTIFF